ncbi:MAG: aminopeptidase N C-terminal domain-containing protein, partial [Pseudomonadota bacterium]
QGYDAMATEGPYSPDAASAGRRSLRNRCLALLLASGCEEARRAAKAQFDGAMSGAGSMTDALAALRGLVHEGAPEGEAALEAFGAKWAADPLVIDKWLAIQATSPAEGALDRVAALAEAPDFPWRNPNKFRALIGAFAMANQVRFHRADGAGYRFFADWLIRMDDANPQTAARVAGAFETWRRYDEERQAKMRAELERILAKPKLSKDMGEIAGRILG